MFGHPLGDRARGPIALTALVATTVVLAGCSSTSADDETDVLRVGVASLSDADAIDPAQATTTGGYIIARQMYDTLAEYGTDGAWQPRLAESIEAGDTADAWTVTLTDATWSDGTAVTADDVVATVQRWFDEELPPSGAMPFIDPDQVVAVDEKTIEFTLLYPTVTFPEALASPTSAIVPATFDPEEPIGSGPFVLEENDPGVQLTFTANEDYFRSAPGVDELEIVSFADATSAASALTAGQIDVDASIDPTIVDTIDGVDGYSIYDYASSGTLTWVMNTEQEPLDDPVVRQALRLAVDRQQLIDQVYNGYGEVGNDYFSPFDPLYNSALPQREYDPAAARAMLEDAGYTLPVEIHLVGTDNQPTSERQNEVLVQQAAEAGFDITYEFVDSATFYGDAYGTYPLSLSYWGFSGIFDQAAFTITDDAPYNSSHWIDDEYDALFDEAISTVDETEREALVAQMQEIEYDRGSYIVPLFLHTLVGLSDEVTGAAAYPNSDGAFGYNFWILSLED
ncbi:ABC transporter substrate-binding protein [Microbacterium tumbae]